MRDEQRFKLRFGPYRAPRYRVGHVVWDEYRGDVRVVRMSDGRIPWPIGQKGTRRLNLILCGDLVRAVKRESRIAVMYWFGVGSDTLWLWRRELGVALSNEGTHELRSELAQEPWAKKARRKAVSKARDPARRVKIAVAKRGKPRPRHVIEAMAMARTGMKHSAATRQKMSESQRRRRELRDGKKALRSP
jgi:hypothetical protein